MFGSPKSTSISSFLDILALHVCENASYFKVRDDGRYVNKALLIVTGIHEDGYREILSAEVADSEDASCWENCFKSLKARGLTGVKLVTSDGHKGIQAAVQEEFFGSSLFSVGSWLSLYSNSC